MGVKKIEPFAVFLLSNRRLSKISTEIGEDERAQNLQKRLCSNISSRLATRLEQKESTGDAGMKSRFREYGILKTPLRNETTVWLYQDLGFVVMSAKAPSRKNHKKSKRCALAMQERVSRFLEEALSCSGRHKDGFSLSYAPASRSAHDKKRFCSELCAYETCICGENGHEGGTEEMSSGVTEHSEDDLSCCRVQTRKD